MPVYSPTFAGTHQLTPEGWHAELALTWYTAAAGGFKPVLQMHKPALHHTATAYHQWQLTMFLPDNGWGGLQMNNATPQRRQSIK